MMAAGVQVPKSRGKNWAPMLNRRASFDVDPKSSNALNVVLVCNKKVERGARQVHDKVRDLVNRHNVSFCFSQEPEEMVKAGEQQCIGWFLKWLQRMCVFFSALVRC
jgi:hypothetical protein